MQIVASIVPPGSSFLPREIKSSLGVWPFTQINWNESRDNHQIFDEPDISVQNQEAVPCTAIVFDIKMWDLQSQKISDWGYSIYPMMKEWKERLYLQSGIQQLPIFKGKPNRHIIDRFIASNASDKDSEALVAAFRNNKTL